MDEVKNNAAEATQQESEAQTSAQTGEVAGATSETKEETKESPKSRDLFFERIRTNFPDSNYDEDEDGYYRDALTRMDGLEKDSALYKSLMEKLNNRLGADPQDAEVFLDWLDGAPIIEAYARHADPDSLSIPKEGTEEYDGWKKAGDERRQELAKMKAQLDEYRSNAEASETALEEFAKENGLSEEQVKELEDYVTENLLKRIYAGKLDKDFYSFVQHARNYAADVEGAREQGRVDGRNEKIEVEKKHLAGSGLPNAKTGGNASEEVDAPKKSNETADWLAKMAKRRV